MQECASPVSFLSRRCRCPVSSPRRPPSAAWAVGAVDRSAVRAAQWRYASPLHHAGHRLRRGPPPMLAMISPASVPQILLGSPAIYPCLFPYSGYIRAYFLHCCLLLYCTLLSFRTDDATCSSSFG
jgi:hypothetical protein